MAGFEPEERQRQAEVVVEVPFGLEDRGVRGQERGGEFLGRRFAHAARDPDDLDPAVAKQDVGQILKGPDGIPDLDQGEVLSGGGDGRGNDGPGRSAFGPGDELVAVAGSDDGEEKVAGPRLAGNRS